MAASTQLLGRVAVVTGAASGIGKATSILFAKEGCNVALLDKSVDKVNELVDQLQNQNPDGIFVGIGMDVSLKKDVQTAVEKLPNLFNTQPSILINAAGITDDRFLTSMTEAQFDKVIGVNLKGTYLMSQAVAKLIQDNGIPDGAIVNISSIVGKVGNIGQVNYAASKAGVIGLTKSCAQELARFGIRCNAVLPGFITTPMTQKVPEPILDKVRQLIPLRRFGTPEEIADICLFLASTRSRYMTGAAVEVTGGLFM